MMSSPKLSVVVPTLSRPDHVRGLLLNLMDQDPRPDEVIVVDGTDTSDLRTEEVVTSFETTGFTTPHVIHIRCERGTARQRNAGLDVARGRYVALIDDDIRLQPGFFRTCVSTLEARPGVGAVCGLIPDQLLDPETNTQWRWMRRLRCFREFRPGHFDVASGHPIPRYLGGPHCGERSITVMGAGCAVWRRTVFDGGLRFDPWFTGYGMLEDVHLSLRASREWTLLELGSARCEHLIAEEGRPNAEELAFRSVVSYRYLFTEIVPTRTVRQELRWWYVQLVDLARHLRHLPSGSPDDRGAARGKVRGLLRAGRGVGSHGRAQKE